MKQRLLKIFLLAQFILFPTIMSGVYASPGTQRTAQQAIEGGFASGSFIIDGISIMFSVGLAYCCFKLFESWKKKGVINGKEQV